MICRADGCQRRAMPNWTECQQHAKQSILAPYASAVIVPERVRRLSVDLFPAMPRASRVRVDDGARSDPRAALDLHAGRPT